MFNDILKYGQEVIADKYIEIPFDILSRISISVNQLYLKADLASHGLYQRPKIEYHSLDNAMRLMQSTSNEGEFVFYTLNYLALRNPCNKLEIFEFLEGC